MIFQCIRPKLIILNSKMKLPLPTYSQVLCMIGLLFSETHMLTNVFIDNESYRVPRFTLIYFSASTLYLLGLVINYGWLGGVRCGPAIDFFQHVGIVVSLVFLRLLLKYDPLTSLPQIACLLLFLAQCLIVSAKVVYLGSLSKELAQISGLIKLARIVKLAVIAIIPQFVTSNLLFAVILSVGQLLTTCIFLFKYTYQKCSLQYIVLIGVLGGLISSLEDMIATVFEFNYYFLGECFIIACSFSSPTPLLLVLELKYRFLFSGLDQNKTEDQYLAELLFIRQCIFTQNQTLNYSQTTKDLAILQMATLMQRNKKVTSIERQNNEQEFKEEEEGLQFLGKIQQGGMELKQSFFQIVLSRYKDSSSFQTFIFSVQCALQLPKQYAAYALILFYGFQERTLHKSSHFQQSRYQTLYKQITKNFSQKYKDAQQINFVYFSQSLQKLSQMVERCFIDQIQLMQALTNDEKRQNLFADINLLKQHTVKQKIRKMSEACFENKLFLCSIEFKYIYLLYCIAIEKRYSQLKQVIKCKFLSVDAKAFQLSYFPRYLAVLNGFGNGEIVISNQAFKTYFKFSANSQNKSSISQLFPTDKQKRKHTALMIESYQGVSRRVGKHSDYQCMLAVQDELNDYKVKTLQYFRIDTRIYCQNQSGFNYVCQIIKLKEKNQEVVSILKKEKDFLQKKGISFKCKNTSKFKQLEQQCEICEVERVLSNQSLATISKIQNYNEHRTVYGAKKETDCMDTSLSDKIRLIQQKLMEEKARQAKGSQFQILGKPKLLLILLMGMVIGGVFWNLSSSIETLNFAVTYELKSLRDANSVRNRVILQKLILSLVAGTSYFPDSVCSPEQIRNLTSYFLNYMIDDMTNSFDAFNNLQVSLAVQTTLLPELYSEATSPVPYLLNFKDTVSFQKYLYLLKAKEIYWANQISSGFKPVINQDYYSQVFPNELLSYSVFSNTSIYSINNNFTDFYYSSLLVLANRMKSIISIMVIAVGIIIVVLVVKNSLPLVEIMQAFESIDHKILSGRLKQLKHSLSLLRRIKNTKIISIEFNQQYVTVQYDKSLIQTKIIDDFTKQGKSLYKINDDEGGNEVQSENAALLKYQQAEYSRKLPKSKVLRALLYNRWYLMLVLMLIGSITVMCLIILGCYSLKIQSLQGYEKIDEKLTLINQKYINIVAYNWLKAFSLVTPSFNMTFVNQLYSDALSSFKSINMQSTFYSKYPSSLANQILYGNSCKYFLNPDLCSGYRLGALTQGLSAILPLAIKQQIEGSEISSTNYSYYIPNACDKTYIFFEGLVPINKQIPLYGFQVVLGTIDGDLTIYIVVTELLMILLLLITMICHSQRTAKQKKLREQVLSLDTVQNLYHNSDLKPYFNQVYYS